MSARKALHFSVTADQATGQEPSLTISTSAPDRHRDRVLPIGGDFSKFLKNPVVMYAHDYDQLPVGTATSLEATESGIRARWRWLENDPFAARVRNAWDQGMLRAASIGFIPKKSVFDEERRGFDFLEWELLEFSIVAIPANAEAVRQLKDLGLSSTPYDEVILAQADDIKAIKADVASLKPAAVLAPAPVVTSEDDADFFQFDPDVAETDLTGDEIAAIVRDTFVGLAREAADQAFLRLSGRVD